jgi:quercetin dioxygenase-like cupin family protein
MKRQIHAVVLSGAALVGAAVPAAAQGTPSSGVSATVLMSRTDGGTDYVDREITIQPGGTTGWHYHDGPLFGVVRSGTLTHVMADCTTVDVYRPGDKIFEASGASKVHVGRNLGTESVVLDVWYAIPSGLPLSEDAADPNCGF